MWLIVGLGNPGPQYETTRHNAGFLVLDLIAQADQLNWTNEASRFGGHLAKGRINGFDVLLLKPMTFMNRSGRSVAAVMRYFKISSDKVVVLHDDLDVPGGKVKAREGGGHGGHNGIRSMIDEIGDPGFGRIKLGIGRPEVSQSSSSEELVLNWVLGRMSNSELELLQSDMFKEVQLRLKGFFDKSSKDKN